jgi:hypothetical protein
MIPAQKAESAEKQTEDSTDNVEEPFVLPLVVSKNFAQKQTKETKVFLRCLRLLLLNFLSV